MIDIKTFLILDGHSLAHRAFHALNAKLTSADGTPTAMLVGFFNMLFNVQDKVRPDCTIAAFDSSGHGEVHPFRFDLQADYKAKRQHMPDDLRVQLKILQEMLPILGIRVIIRDDVEADDVVASAAKKVRSAGHQAVAVSSDKDLFQVIGDGINVIRIVKQGTTGAITYDTARFYEEYGFPPSSKADFLALLGDKIDNVRGVDGIGEVTAKKLLAAHPTIEQIFDSLPDIPKSTRAKLEAAGREKVLWTRDNMIKLRDNLFDDDEGFVDDCLNYRLNFPEAEKTAVTLGLTAILKRIGSTKKPLPRILDGSGRFALPRAEVIVDDYKTALKENPGLLPDNVWDFHTAYYLLHPDKAAANFPERLAYIRASENPAQTLAHFAGGLQGEIEAHEGLAGVMHSIDIPLIPVLNKMEERGVRISQPHFEALAAELEGRIACLEADLISKTGVRINMNSPQQVSWLLFEHLDFKPTSKTKSGAPSVDAYVLAELAKESDDEVPRILINHRELSKMLTGFVVPFLKAGSNDGVIHTTFEPAVTGTGRLSSRDPNVQNIPAFGEWAAKLKAGLLPVSGGNIFVGADYSQIELRVLARLSGEERLLEAFAKGRDIHAETASWVFGVMPELVTPELRRTAKMINFGLLYGMTEFGLADRLGVPRAEAKEIMAKYFAALPGLKAFLEGVVDEARSRGFTRTLAGRIRPLSEIQAKGPALDRAIVNSPIQGTAADIARKAMIAVEREMPGRMFLQVHDSIVCECRESEADEVSESLKEIMTASGIEAGRLEVEAKRGKSLADV